MCKRIMGRIRETKVTDTELNWLYSALIARQPIDPSYLMINRWCCKATSGSGDIGSGCYLSMLSISLRPGITRNSKYLLPGTPLGFEYLKQGTYISGDERGGFPVAKVNLPLSYPRLRLFIQGKEDWLEEGHLVPAKKNKRGRIVEEGPPPRKWVVHSQTMCHHSEESLLRQIITEGHKCKHGGVVHRCPHKIMWCPT
jgi:hypothetical protein